MRSAYEEGGTVDFEIDPGGFETKAIHSLVDFAGKSVLEIGSGDGRLTWRFADEAARVLAFDPMARDVRRAVAATPEQLRSKVRFVEADATTFHYGSATFDVAILSYSL